MRISVALTTYNRSGGLCRTLESISKQTRLPDELIISDNASQDNTSEIAAQWAPHFKGFKYIRNPENIGMPGNLNKAISETGGDLVVNLHDADRYEPELIERCEALMAQNPSVGMIFWASDRNYMVDRQISPITDGREFFKLHYLGKTSSKIWGTAMVRREVYDKLMPFDARFNAWADVDMWMRISLDWQIGYISDPLMELYDEEGQFKVWNWEKALLIQQMFFLNICRHFEEYPAEMNSALRIQLKTLKLHWWRFVLGRIKNREWSKLFEAPRYYQPYHSYPEIIRPYLGREFY